MIIKVSSPQTVSDFNTHTKKGIGLFSIMLIGVLIVK